MTGFIQVVTTTEKREDADRLAGALVSQRLVACVQILGPITSTYWWRGRVETAHEWLCLAKTRESLFQKVQEAIRQIHPYEVPEIIAVPIALGSDAYLAWLDQEIQGQRATKE